VLEDAGGTLRARGGPGRKKEGLVLERPAGRRSVAAAVRKEARTGQRPQLGGLHGSDPGGPGERWAVPGPRRRVLGVLGRATLLSPRGRCPEEGERANRVRNEMLQGKAPSPGFCLQRKKHAGSGFIFP